MKLKFASIVSMIFMSAALMLLSGCEFDTYVKIDTKPEAAVMGFFESLKSKDFENCGKYLANNDSFEITNNTGYEFADAVLDKQIESLNYSIVSDSDINGEDASCKVLISCINLTDIEKAMSEQYAKICSQYMKENNLKEFPIEDNEVVNAVALSTFDNVIDSVEPVQKEIIVQLKYQSGGWKLIADEEFCQAIFGGDAE